MKKINNSNLPSLKQSPAPVYPVIVTPSTKKVLQSTAEFQRDLPDQMQNLLSKLEAMENRRNSNGPSDFQNGIHPRQIPALRTNLEAINHKRSSVTKESIREVRAGNEQSLSVRNNNDSNNGVQYKPLFMPEPRSVAKLPERNDNHDYTNISSFKSVTETTGSEQPP